MKIKLLLHKILHSYSTITIGIGVGGLLLFLSLSLSAAPKLTRNYAYRHFTTRDGLTQMQVMCVFQDSDGFMWFGTKGGVSRWDGTSFKNYTSEDGLPLGETRNICEWGSRKLFFTARKMAILVQKDSILVQSLPDKKVFEGHDQKTIPIDRDNVLILGLLDDIRAGLNYPGYTYNYNFKTKKFTEIANFKHVIVTVFGNNIVTSKGLYYWADGKINLKLKFPFEVIYAIFDEKIENCVLQGVNHNNYASYKIKNGRFIRNGKLFEGSAHRCSWLSDGSLLSLSNNEHCFVPQRTIALHTNFTYPNFSFTDKENNVWIGTENGLYNFFNLTIEEYNFNLGTPDNIWSIVEDKTGTMWLGSYGNGLYTLKNEVVKRIDYSKELGDWEKAANTLLYMGSTTDGDKTVYMSSGNGVINFTSNKFKKISLTPGCLYSYFDKLTNQIMYSGIDTTNQKRGLFIGMDANRKFYPFENGFPVCIIRDGNGVIRVGAFRGTGRLENEQLVIDTAKHAYTGVVSMDLDNKKRLWKATEKGIYVEMPTGQEFRISPSQLTGAYTSLIVYKNKYLIVGGTHGFAIVDIEKNTNYEHLAVVNIGYEGGFTGLESGQNGICVDSQGYVWLATALNVLKFNPHDIVKNHLKHVPKLRINKLSYSSDNTNWKSYFFSAGATKISSDNKFIQIEYIANSISAPKSLRFKYRLIGLSDKWSESVQTKSVNYTNIGFGKYHFEVQSSMDGLHWSPVVQSPEIEITVPFYLRPIAFGLYLLLVIALSIYLTRKFTKQKQAKQLLEMKRTKLENELQLNTLRSKIIPHFSKNVLSAIGHFAMTDKLKAGHYISVFSKFTSLTLANADKNYISLQEEMEYIEKYLELEKMRFGDKFNYKIHIDKNVAMDLLIPTMTLHTYCDNAIRHGLVPRNDGGELLVEVKEKLEGVLITVSDNGVGQLRAMELGTQGNRQGLKLAEAQLDFYNQTNEQKMLQKIINLTDEKGNATGTRVELFIPYGFKFE